MYLMQVHLMYRMLVHLWKWRSQRCSKLHFCFLKWHNLLQMLTNIFPEMVESLFSAKAWLCLLLTSSKVSENKDPAASAKSNTNPVHRSQIQEDGSNGLLFLSSYYRHHLPPLDRFQITSYRPIESLGQISKSGI